MHITVLLVFVSIQVIETIDTFEKVMGPERPEH